jgi:hypothetical protein
MAAWLQIVAIAWHTIVTWQVRSNFGTPILAQFENEKNINPNAAMEDKIHMYVSSRRVESQWKKGVFYKWSSVNDDHKQGYLCWRAFQFQSLALLLQHRSPSLSLQDEIFG